MDMNKNDIERAIEHQRKMLRTLRSRLEQRELQEAQQGLNTPPEIITEINDLTERIQRHEAEIARLQTEAAVDKLSLVEAEYRALLAEVWDTENGRITVAGAARLELTRLRLGLTLERARELEQEVRVALAKEAMYKVDLSLLISPRGSSSILVYRLFARVVRLDLPTAVQFFLSIPVDHNLPTLDSFGRQFLQSNTVWADKEDQALLEHFLQEVGTQLASRPVKVTSFPSG